MGLLEGKVAIITGAGQGLGAETARLFAREGASVVLGDVADDEGEAVAAGIRADGGRARYRHVDVRRGADLDAAVADAEDEFGRLDVLVANAGVLGDASFRPSDTLTDEQWSSVLDVNLSGTFRSFRAAIPALRRAGGGALSATSSTAGVHGVLHRIAYSSSKGGMNAMVRSLAAEFAPDRIRVNAMAPGSMSTNITASLGRSTEELQVERPPKDFKARMRWPERDMTADAAKVHLFLCSDLANYVSGETIVVDGGVSMWTGN